MRRIAYAVYGDAADPGTQSSVAFALHSALLDRGDLAVTALNTRPRRLAISAAAAVNFRRGRDRWRWAAHQSPALTRARTTRLESLLAQLEPAPELVLSLRSTYLPLNLPYAPYVDNTVALSRAWWPPAAPWRGRALRRILDRERAFFEGAAHVFATGELVASSLRSDYGLADSKVSVVGLGARYAPLAELPAAGDRRPWVLFVGYDFTRKGGDRLVEAFRLARRECPDASLKIVGPDITLSEPGVDVLGPVSDPGQLAALYRQARVFALPVRYEPFGGAFLEAMAHGMPCVGTAAGAIPEIIDDGRSGYVVDGADADGLAAALVRLVRDPAHAHRLGEAGWQRVRRQFNWEVVAGRIAKRLHDLDPGETSRR